MEMGLHILGLPAGMSCRIPKALCHAPQYRCAAVEGLHMESAFTESRQLTSVSLPLPARCCLKLHVRLRRLQDRPMQVKPVPFLRVRGSHGLHRTSRDEWVRVIGKGLSALVFPGARQLGGDVHQ